MEERHLFVILLTLLVQQCVTSPVWMPQFLSGGTGRNIRHLPCVSRRTGDAGTCMFAIHCMKANGTHLGTCIDRFYFGSCCRLNDPQHNHNNESNYLPVLPPSKVTYVTRPTTERVRTTTSKRIVHPVGNDATTETNYQLSTFQSVQDNENTVGVDVVSTSRPLSHVTVRPTAGHVTTTGSVASSSAETTTSTSTEKPATSSKPTLSTSKPVKTTTSKPTKTTTSKPKPTYQKPTTTSPKPTKPTQASSKPVKVTKPPKVPYLNDTTSSPSKPTKPPTTTTSRPITTRPPPPKTTTTTTTTTEKPTKKPASTKKPTIKPTTPPPEDEFSEVSLITKPVSIIETKPTTPTTTQTTTPKPVKTTTTKPVKTTQTPSKTTPKPTTTATKPPKTTPKPTSKPTSKPTKPSTTTPKPVKSTSKPPRPSSTPVPKPAADVATKPSTRKPPTDALGEFNQIEVSTKQPTTSGGLVTWTSVELESQSPTTQATSITTRLSTTSRSTTTEKVTSESTESVEVSTSSSSSSETSISTESWVLIPDPTPPPMATAITESTPSSTPIFEEVVTEEQLPMTSEEPSGLNMSDFTDVCGRRLFPEARIVGGEKASFGKWPWQISLRQWRTSTYLHKCGAALLNENWAITAAHCVENVPPNDLLLRLGEHDLSSEDEPYGYQERRVQIVASHPQFDPRTFEYDLALLRFYEPVAFQPNILPVCVPQDDTNFVGKTAHVTGWGRLYEDGPLPSMLQEVSVPVINNTLCETMYRSAGYIEHIPNIFICAGWKKGGFDSCEGDSGGPMVIQRPDRRWLLAGVISWGIGCAEPNQPGVYTRISEFREWINQILQF